MSIKLNDIQQARHIIKDRVLNTPCSVSLALSKLTGTETILKFENKQFTGSFKDRGALVKLLSLDDKTKKQGVIAMSAGNHAQAVAYHSKSLDIPATIVMPINTPNVKVRKTQSFGAEVVLHGKDLFEAGQYTKKLMSEKNLTLIHPYNDEKIISGQGTIALEMLEDYPDLDVLVVPIGGGGLISGNAIAAKAIKQDIKIIGVQTENYPSMYKAVKAEEAVFQSSSIADGIAVKTPGSLTLEIIRDLVDEIVLVSEIEIEEAVLTLLEIEKSVVEGAGAVGLAAMLQDKEKFSDKKTGLILSGGNIDLLVLSSIIQRGLARTHRLARLKIIIPDVPGSLSDVTELLGNSNANIIEVRHQRAFTNLSLKSAEVEFVIQTLGTDHLEEIIKTIKDADYDVHLEDIEVF
ncbi:MAG TPA: threonine ammonia-lyase [Thermodesulfobacteriota bacterium]|nr:threonine ammonia-lyase [Thermodesulfobacteriota bacterium]